MKRAFWLGMASGAVAGWGFCEPWLVQVRRFEVELENLPRECDGLRVLQISDLHAGLVTPELQTRRVFELAQGQNPDIVVLTGDLVSRRSSFPPLVRLLARSVEDYARGLVPMLRDLRAPLGVWAVAGNHVFGEVHQQTGDFAPVRRQLESAGVRVLNNESARLGSGLAIVGLDDLREGRPDVHLATHGVSPGEAQLVLSHNPRCAALFAQRNALILSGHTHGGQIALPSPFRLYPVDSMASAWQSGWWQVGRAQLYVSRGAGQVKLPFRVGVPPEIVVFTLRHA